MTSIEVARYLDHYDAVRLRIVDLVRAADPDVIVPACPAWTVRNVVSHLTGLCEDWVNAHLDGYASEAWTAGQVDRHASRTIDEILQTWAERMNDFTRLREPVMGLPPSRWAFGDAVIHEADLRNALHAARVPADAVHLSLDGTIIRWRREVLDAAGAPTINLRTGPEHGLSLTHETRPNEIDLEVPAYELFRAPAGRRTIDQASNWNWSSDPGPILRCGLPYPFHWAAAPFYD